MKKLLISGLFIGFIVVQGGLAQAVTITSSGSLVGGPVTVASTVPSTILFDEDHSDDEIVQINNLRIQEVTAPTLPMIVTATSDFGVRCRMYDASDRITPCPLSPLALYKIRVTSDTILLLKNRQRAQMGDFKVGDLINVYGFRDPQSNSGIGIDALIMRNLDRPTSERFIQLNSVEVIAPPSSLTPPATIGVVRKPTFPCWDFGEWGTSVRVEFPCPLGVRSFSPSLLRVSESQFQTIAPDPQPVDGVVLNQKYVIEITPATKILFRNRAVANLADITMGDELNIYGVLKADGVTVEARIIRDLTKPIVNSTGKLSITTASNLNTTVGNYFVAEFKVSGGHNQNPYQNPYTITSETSIPGPSNIPGLTLSRGRPCPLGLPCAMVYTEDPSSVFLYGTPTVPGRYQLTISAVDNPPIITCIVPSPEFGIRAPCPSPEKSFGRATFTLVVNSGITDVGVITISSVTGPTALRAYETGSWAVTVLNAPLGSLTYSVVWGDEQSVPTNVGVSDISRSGSSSGSFTHAYRTPGTYTPKFTVTSGNGQSSSAQMSVTVNQ